MTRLQIIWEITNHTPTWVWFVFGWLLIIGIKALRKNTAHIGKLFVLPTIFFVLAVHTLAIEPVVTWTILFVFVASCIGCISIGLTVAQGQQFTVDKKQWQITLPGSSFTLIFVMIIFASKYYFCYTTVAHPEVAYTLAFKIMKFAFSGGLTGLAIGRIACYIERMQQAKG